MVSYFSGTSDNAYPSINYIQEEIPMSLKQSELTDKIVSKDTENGDEFSESFLAKQRQIAIAVPKVKVLSNLKEYAPKIKKLYQNIVKTKKGKHLVFSNFIKNGLSIVEKLLKAKGWANYLDIIDNNPEEYNYKVYVLWDGSLKDKDKQAVKSKVNSISNIDGKFIKVVLGSPSIKEGVSFKHIQHLHLLDPVWNNSAKRQVEGRAIRFCSHSDIPKNSPSLKRAVDVHLYKSIPHSTSTFGMTCDQQIYVIIIPEKKKRIDIAEKALKRVAIDNFLFRNMYEDKVHESPEEIEDGEISPLNISDDDFNLKRQKKNKGKAQDNNCPKVRRPDAAGNCNPGMYLKENKHGMLCCYKKTKNML
jgi:hypothetical protein